MFGRIFSFSLALGLRFFKRHTWLTPQLGRLAALTIGKANDSDIPTQRMMQHDGSAGVPHKISRVG